MKPTFIENVDPIELVLKDSCLNSLNQSKEKRNLNLERKIQLSANRLSSKKCSSSAREYLTSEENSQKGCPNLDLNKNSSESLHLHQDGHKEESYVKKCDFTESSNQSAEMNQKGERELASFSNNEFTQSNDGKSYLTVYLSDLDKMINLVIKDDKGFITPKGSENESNSGLENQSSKL